MIKFDKVSKSYGDVVAIKELSFELKSGSILGLLGSNGAGKTTTFRLILELLKPTTGTVEFFGELNDKNKHQMFGYIPEERALVAGETVIKQILFFAALKGVSKEVCLKQLDYYLDVFNIQDYKNIKVNKLSKGNQQKIQFILAVIGNPKLLILDEPFTGLDPQTVNILKEELQKLKAKGTSIIFSSHQMNHIEGICDEIIILVKGTQMIYGNTLEIQKESEDRKIYIRGDIDYEEFATKVPTKNYQQVRGEHVFEVKKENVKEVFNIIKQQEIIEKFAAEYPTIEDIFIKCVDTFNSMEVDERA